jgi:hypothetical protein
MLVSEAAFLLGDSTPTLDTVVLARPSSTGRRRSNRILVRLFVTLAPSALLGSSPHSVGVLRPGDGRSFQVTVVYSRDHRPMGILDMQLVSGA